MFKFIKRKIQKTLQSEPLYQFQEDVDYMIIPDVEGAKREEPNPWFLKFRDRIIKVHSVKVGSEPRSDGQLPVAINADIITGEAFTEGVAHDFGDLVMELALKGIIAKEANT